MLSALWEVCQNMCIRLKTYLSFIPNFKSTQGICALNKMIYSMRENIPCFYFSGYNSECSDLNIYSYLECFCITFFLFYVCIFINPIYHNA